MIRLKSTALSVYGKTVADFLKATESELDKHCSCPPGESCKVEINELPDKNFEVIVVRPGPVSQSTDWLPMAAVKGTYRRLFKTRTTAERIREAIAKIVGAPLEEDKNICVEPSPTHEQNVVFADPEMLHQARRLITGCQACSPNAEIPFESILDRVSGHHPAVTRYILAGSVRCPRCLRRVTANTFVEFEPPIDDSNGHLQF